MQWRPEQSKILTKAEIGMVVDDLTVKSYRSLNSRMNMVIFKLAIGCGLRANEIAKITLGNVKVGIQKPYIYVPKTIAKGRKHRHVPLWWDKGTLRDIREWKELREGQGAQSSDPFVCALAKNAHGNQLHRNHVRDRFIRACAVLGPDREITVHDGRHTFVSHMLAAGRSLAEVRDAAGHSSISTTSIYTHIAADDEGEVTEVYTLSMVEA